MKTLLLPRVTLPIFLASVIATSTYAQLLHDDFNGSSIDTSIWTPSTPFSDSSITESGGNAIFQNRGRLLSVSSLPTAIDVTGRFAFVGSAHDQFKVLTRTDGTSTNPSAEFDRGIGFYFQMQSDTGSLLDNISIVRHDFPNTSPILAVGTFPLSLNTFYNFRITDDGTNLALYITNLNTPLLTAVDPTTISNHLGMYNREGAGAGSLISAGSTVDLDFITVVPEPSGLGLLVIGGLCFAAIFPQGKKTSYEN